MPTLIQRSFAGGKVSRNVYGRADLTKWQTGLKECKNFIVERSGSITNRQGTRHVCSAQDGTSTHRLIKFRFNDDTTYVLVFGSQTMQVIKANGTHVYNGASPYSIATPYLSSDLAKLRFAQSGNVLTIVHPSYAIRKLTHVSATNWTMATETIGATLAAPTGLASASAGTAYYYVVTAFDLETGEESVASAEAGSANKTSGLTWTAVTGADEYNVYRRDGTGGVFGFIGTSTENKFTDVSINPDNNTNPPTNTNPFGSSNLYPGAVGYYQQRRLYAGSNTYPERVWASHISLYNNFDTHRVSVDSDSIEFDLAGSSVSKVLHVAELGRLIVFTENGEWLIKGDGDGALLPTAINASQQSFNGVGDVPPLPVNNTLLYLQKRGGAVRDLQYDFNTDGYKGDDLTVFSTDLFEGKTFTSWDYAQKPYSVVWMVRNDGKMLGLTYLRDHQVFAWHEHETDGLIKDVCVVPNGDYDRVFMIVERNGAQYVEYMADPFYTNSINDAWYVDCGYLYIGRNRPSSAVDGTTTAWSAPVASACSLDLQGTLGTVNDILLLNNAGGLFTSSMEGDSFSLSGNVVDVVQYISSTQVSVRPRKNLPSGFTFTSSTNYVHMPAYITGLTALAGKSVSALADGAVIDNISVTGGGTLTLPRGYSNIKVGLAYTSDMETLGVENVQGETLIDRKKIVRSVTALVKSSRGLWAGMDEDHLNELKPSDQADQGLPPALVTGTVDVRVNSKWDDFGRIFIRQYDPLPLSILSVAYNVEAGG